MKNLRLKIIFVFAIFLAILFLPKISWAADYYVSTSGSDSNLGTLLKPWKTIQKAVNTAKGGDTVNVRAGVYNERVDLSGTTGVEGKSGDAVSGYITYQSFPGETAILDGSVFTDWGAGFMSGKWVPSGSERAMNYIKIYGLEIRNYPESGVFFENNRKAGPDGSVASHHIIIENNVFKNCKAGQASILFEGGDQAVGGEGHDFIVRGNTVENSGAHGIKFTGDEPTVINREHIYNSVIENNIVYGSGYIGIHVSTGHYNITVRNNTVYNSTRQGIAAHEIWDSTYEGNVVYNNGLGAGLEDQGIVIWRSKNVTVSGNQIYNNVQGFGISLSEKLPGSISASHLISNNIIYNNGAGNTESGGISIGSNVGSSKIYNNIIASNKGLGIRADNSDAGNIVENNILYQNSPQLWQGTGNVYDYNLYFPDISFTGKGSHDITGDPQFVNTGVGDYHLVSSSPAINKGASLLEVSKDIEGNARPQGSAYDIGAYEYVGAPPPDTTPPAAPTRLIVN